MAFRVWTSASVFCVLASSIVQAEDVARLYRWEGPATLVTNHGPGATQVYLLVAEVGWTPSASRDAGAYTMRLLLPDGTQKSDPVSVQEGPGVRLLTFLVPADAVRNLRPRDVALKAWVSETETGQPVSRALKATSADFPNPGAALPPIDRRPFGWGTPLSASSGVLPTASPDGTRFARIPPAGESPGFFLATTELTNSQVSTCLPAYDPRAGRSDEFSLEAPDQPAIGLTPQAAESVLAALSKSTGLHFRLPTVDEWLRAARAGESTSFWWGEEPTDPAGANFLGPEPPLQVDSTAASREVAGQASAFVANPWGLRHTFGNVAEWAAAPSGGFVRLGGHFRTEPAVPLPAPKVTDPTDLGGDPYVGLRPAFDLKAEEGSAILAKRLAEDPALKNVDVHYNPETSAATLTGTVDEPTQRRKADELLRGVWWLAAVVNELRTPALSSDTLARLGAQQSPAKTVAPLGHVMTVIPVDVRWESPLPVAGSDWWVNIYGPDGRHDSHRLTRAQPGRSAAFDVVLDRTEFAAGPVSVALSLGTPAETPSAPNVVSNLATINIPAP